MSQVSVIIPTYQRGHLIGEAIESVLAQSYREYEIIIVIDGSTDDTASRIGRFGQQIQIIEQSNRGLSAARNVGIAAANGAYIAFLDDDDQWLPHKLEQQMTVFAQNPDVGLVYGDMLFFDEHGERDKSYAAFYPPPLMQVAATLFRSNFIPVPTVVVRRACLDRVGLFDESLTACEDYDLWLRIIEQWPIHGTTDIVARYRMSDDNMQRDKVRMVANELRVREKALARNATLRHLPQVWLDDCYYNLFLHLARLHSKRGNRDEAHATLLRYREVRGETAAFTSLWDELRCKW